MSRDHRLWVALAALFVLAPPGALAKKNKATVMSPRDIPRINQVTDAAISPNGKSVAYTLWVQSKPFKDDDGPGWRELHVVDTDGTTRAFIRGKVQVKGIQWTSDGSAISFLAKRGDDKQTSLYTISLTGGEAQRVLSHSSGISSYAWHPSKMQVAFLARPVTAKAKKDLAKKGFKAEIYEEELHNAQIWIAHLGTTDEKPRRIKLSGSVSELSWSPDGKSLACALAPTPLVDDHYMKRRVMVVDIKSGKIRDRINNPGKLAAIRWSPDSRHIALLAGGDPNDPAAQRLAVASAGGGAMRDLLEGFEGGVTSVAWLDAKHLIYIAERGTESSIEKVDLSGQRTVLVNEGHAALSHLSLSRRSGAFAVVAHHPKHPRELFLGNSKSRDLIRVTDSNPWLDKRVLGRQESILYKARDGKEIGGLLIHPIGKIAKGGAPLIIQVHGGPESHYRNGWVTSYSNLGQVAAGRGFAVFYPNYRGSTGRGVAYSKADHGDPAGKEFDDIVDGIDYLAGRGIVDKERVGCMGGSYGGYASAWAATYYSHRYKAAAVFVGVADQISKIGTTDITNEMISVHFRKKPWEHWDFFLKRSPIYHAHKSTTATLILHGKADTRVDPGQSRELYRHLKLRGKAPVRLVLYPGEGHGNRKAAARFDYHLRTLRWMEHFLKGNKKAMPGSDLEYKKALGIK